MRSPTRSASTSCSTSSGPPATTRQKACFSAAGRRKLYPKSKPDRGKYLRAIEDAMTKLVYVDDAQIVSGTVDKRYGAPARALVKVFTLNEDDAVQDEADELARDAA